MEKCQQVVKQVMFDGLYVHILHSNPDKDHKEYELAAHYAVVEREWKVPVFISEASINHFLYLMDEGCYSVKPLLLETYNMQ